jgi:hypothetical protein
MFLQARIADERRSGLAASWNGGQVRVAVVASYIFSKQLKQTTSQPTGTPAHVTARYDLFAETSFTIT